MAVIKIFDTIKGHFDESCEQEMPADEALSLARDVRNNGILRKGEVLYVGEKGALDFHPGMLKCDHCRVKGMGLER